MFSNNKTVKRMQNKQKNIEKVTLMLENVQKKKIKRKEKLEMRNVKTNKILVVRQRCSRNTKSIQIKRYTLRF